MPRGNAEGIEIERYYESLRRLATKEPGNPRSRSGISILRSSMPYTGIPTLFEQLVRNAQLAGELRRRLRKVPARAAGTEQALLEHGQWLPRKQYTHLLTDIKRDRLRALSGGIAATGFPGAHCISTKWLPDADYASYAEAQQAFQQNEELTFSMLEIDLMLPPMLRDEPREQTHLE